MIFQKFKSKVAQNVTNMPGWRTNRKIVVFESDDWGSMRMPSKNVYNKLLNKGIKVDNSYYDKYDCLENRSDLLNLFQLLTQFKSKDGTHPKFTFNTVMGNPDFEKIQKNDFNSFYHEHFFSSYKKYYGENNEGIWFEAIKNKLIKPQFHAREHLNTSLWMNDLKAGVKETRLAFDHSFFGVKTKTSFGLMKSYLAAYYNTSVDDLINKKIIIADGLNQFFRTFNFESESFISCRYVWPIEIEDTLFEYKVKYIQGQRVQLNPKINSIEKKRHFTGERNSNKQLFLVRNCVFEPTSSPNRDWVGECMSDIKSSFFWKKPAIISTHRINYVSGLSVRNKDIGLKLLTELLQNILKTWPNVEFMSSDELGKTIIET